MKKLVIFFICFLCCAFARADEPVPRVSLFSTSVDWYAVTGLPLRQYFGNFSGKNPGLINKGLVLYYLDAFPCYGEADSVRVWISKKGDVVGNLRIVCVSEPKEISFAWRNADRDSSQYKTDGILTCPVMVGGRDFDIDLSKCVRGPDWKEFK